MLNLETNNLKFKFNGKEQSMRFPTVKEWGSYRKKLKGSEGEEAELMLKFFVDLGLDKKVAESLEAHHAESLVSALIEKKS